MSSSQSVQCFGKKKTATAVAHCKQGQGLIKVNGQPISLVQPEILRFKVYEPILILGLDKFGMRLPILPERQKEQWMEKSMGHEDGGQDLEPLHRTGIFVRTNR